MGTNMHLMGFETIPKDSEITLEWSVASHHFTTFIFSLKVRSTWKFSVLFTLKNLFVCHSIFKKTVKSFKIASYYNVLDVI